MTSLADQIAQARAEALARRLSDTSPASTRRRPSLSVAGVVRRLPLLLAIGVLVSTFFGFPAPDARKIIALLFLPGYFLALGLFTGVLRSERFGHTPSRRGIITDTLITGSLFAAAWIDDRLYAFIAPLVFIQLFPLWHRLAIRIGAERYASRQLASASHAPLETKEAS